MGFVKSGHVLGTFSPVLGDHVIKETLSSQKGAFVGSCKVFWVRCSIGLKMLRCKEQFVLVYEEENGTKELWRARALL